ncbi:MAG: DUF4242 domain-containing protein [Ferruginibacter sp.]
MPIYMDVHIVPGVKAKDVADAHRKDLLHQHDHGCNCMTYWIDEQRESIFCLIEAPNKDAVVEMHNQAHGLVPNRVMEVSSNVVESFLGRIYDPENATVSNDGLKVFEDPSYRIIIVIDHEDPVLLQHKLGNEKAAAMLHAQQQIVRKHLTEYGGREAEHDGTGYILSFVSPGKAIEYANSVLTDLNKAALHETGYRLALHGGEPMEKSNTIFGDTIQFARHLCFVTGNRQIAVSNTVKNFVAKDHSLKEAQYLCFSLQDENLLRALFDNLEKYWQDADFDIDSFSKEMAMSKSQLYRKIISLTGSSPNTLLKDYRLLKAKELMRKQCYNIAQVTFDSGFTSASYFTKCFKQKFELLPMAYLELLK